MKQRIKLTLGCLSLAISLLSLTTGAKTQKTERDVPPEQRMSTAGKLQDFTKNRRSKPIFSGAFPVGFAFVDFPDTEPPVTADCLKRQTEGVEAYYHRYTIDHCWPTFEVIGPTYRAPHVLGYYVRYEVLRNRIGWTSESEGAQRVAQLRKDAFAFARRQNSKKYAVTVLAYASKRAPMTKLKSLKEIRSLYVEKVQQSDMEIQTQGVIDYPDQLEFYAPSTMIRWADPLWPNSSILVQAEGDSGTLIHELGHVLGAPDFYHAPSVNDGVPGNPIIVPGGPTGPLYCRYKYCGLMDETAYPMLKSDNTITLAPRWQEGKSPSPVGVFIPTQHPHYLLYLEYEPAQVAKVTSNTEDVVGRYATEPASVSGGILIYYINLTLQDPYHGHPDLCYTYRTGDPDLHGTQGDVVQFKEGDSFNDTSDPRNSLPNQLPTGVTLTFGPQTATGAEVTIQVPTRKLSGTALKTSLLPILSLTQVDELQPTSLHASLAVHYRGEPLLTEYGICVGPSPHPTTKQLKFPLFHRDRYEGRLLNLRPGATYYVRAYATNALGTAYSPTEEKVTLPKVTASVPPLLHDNFTVDNELVGMRYDRQYREGYVIGATGFTALLKLVTYLREPLVKDKKLSFDPSQIHISPSKEIYPPRLKDFFSARDLCKQWAETAGMMENTFPKDFDKRCAKVFKFDMKQRGKEPIVTIDETTIAAQEPRIKAALLLGRPLLVIRQTQFFSPTQRALNSCLIDGMKEGEEGEMLYHIVYPEGCDRGLAFLKRPTGWYPLNTVVDAVEQARLLYFLPTKQGTFSR